MTTPQNKFIGINVSGEHVRAALVDEHGAILKSKIEGISKELIPQLAAIVQELRTPEVAAIGVAIPGLVNRQTDRVVAPRDLPSTIVEDLHGELTRATGLRVELENDANAAAYGEFKVGAGRGSRNLFYMMIGNGIGGAIILDGKLWTGASGFAGEVGHITIDTEGLECVCGNTRLSRNSCFRAEHRAARARTSQSRFNFFSVTTRHCKNRLPPKTSHTRQTKATILR